MQMKQNILGYYGLGSAIQGLISEDSNSLTKLQTMYNSSSLFKGLMDNAMQSLAHTNFALTSHLHQDAKFGKFWDKLHIEAQLSRDLLLKISGQSSLLAENSLKQQTINFREQIIQPLIIIQQYAMDKLRNLEREHVDYLAYENLVKKSLAASINASRNSI
jgi:phosphoenolpyruvate carboxylase